MSEEDRDHGEKLNSKRLLDAANNRINSLQAENEGLKNRVELLEGKDEQNFANRQLSHQIIQEQIDRVNAQNNEYLEEIKRLREEIRKLKGE
jgi:hypothetical protein